MSEEKPAYLAALTEDHVSALADFKSVLPKLLTDVDYTELYGHNLSVPSVTVDVLLLKFLVANAYDVPASREQLLKTLKWRKEFKPLAAAFDEEHDARFDGLGYITTAKKDSPTGDIITWNLYGQAAATPQVVFGDVDLFLRWRVGLMERGLQLLDFESTRTQIDQVHDYSNISFLRMDPAARAASKVAVATFQAHYPEMLGKKYFVNVPLIMGWMFSAMKLMVKKETIAKFTVLSYGSYLAEYVGMEIPKVYGGNGKPLKDQDLSPSISRPAIADVVVALASAEPKPVATEPETVTEEKTAE
ncbi:CRAL-TRIO domain-containing protein [Limtongia smithiae]|uniref:CRAL-TRIO domain-containing protein n=1 Tax=Limtongia smithiae TaxID=1125753 RepID=UPI0034CE6119